MRPSVLCLSFLGSAIAAPPAAPEKCTVYVTAPAAVPTSQVAPVIAQPAAPAPEEKKVYVPAPAPAPVPVPATPAPAAPAAQPNVAPATATTPAQPVEPAAPAPVAPSNSVAIPGVPISSGQTATLTHFTDTVSQCIGPIPAGIVGVAVNPSLLGIAPGTWNNVYANTAASNVPWCNRKMSVTVKGKTIVAQIIDTCDPTGIGAVKCDYDNVIDFWGEPGEKFLKDAVGDNFYQGSVDWKIL